jgi:hypothetical protein
MSLTSDPQCLAVLTPLLTALGPQNSQWPCLLFSEAHCQGEMYPPVGSFNDWNKHLTRLDIGFETIGSVFVPPQIILQMWTPNNGNTYTAPGQQVIIDTASQMAFWRNWDDSTCESPQSACGTKVNWTFGTDANSLYKLIMIPLNWNATLTTYGATKQPFQIGPNTIPMNLDQFFSETCASNDPAYTTACLCQNAYINIIENHNTSANQSYVNLLQNGCNPSSQFVPSQANIAVGTTDECLEMMNAQIAAGTFPTLSNGGPANYICNNQIYVNAYSTGSTSALAFADDFEDDQIEQTEMNSQTPPYAYIILAVLLFVAILLVLFYFLRIKIESPVVVKEGERPMLRSYHAIRVRQSKFSKKWA